MRRLFAILLAAVLLDPGLIYAGPTPGGYGSTATPIKHVVIIFGENVSFDHYFGTYPSALNLKGESTFFARPDTPSVNGYSPALLTANPNLNPANGAGATNPFRLSPSQASTADQDHNYTPNSRRLMAESSIFSPSSPARAARPRVARVHRRSSTPPGSRWATTTETP